MKFVLCMKGSVLNALKGNNSDNIVQKRIILELSRKCANCLLLLVFIKYKCVFIMLLHVKYFFKKYEFVNKKII